MIMSFAGYSFCKGHSASYIQVAQHSCYLRAHYPAEFMAAVLANGGGFYHPFAYVAEAMRMGLTVLPPDVNASDFRCTGRGTELRIGLQFMKGLSAEGAERILRARWRQGGAAWADEARASSERKHAATRVPTCRRTAVPLPTARCSTSSTAPASADDLRALIKVGALDSIADGWTRPMMLWMVDTGGAGGASTVRPAIGLPTSPPPSPSSASTPPSAAAGRSTRRSASSPTPTPCTSTPTRWPASGSAAAPSCIGTSAATCCCRDAHHRQAGAHPAGRADGVRYI